MPFVKRNTTVIVSLDVPIHSGCPCSDNLGLRPVKQGTSYACLLPIGQNEQLFQLSLFAAIGPWTTDRDEDTNGHKPDCRPPKDICKWLVDAAGLRAMLGQTKGPCHALYPRRRSL